MKKKKQLEDNIIKDVRNLNQALKKKKSKNKTKVNYSETWELFLDQKKEENYYQPVSVGNFYSNNNIKYESNGDQNKTLLVKEYLDKVNPYLKDMINNLNKSDINDDK